MGLYERPIFLFCFLEIFIQAKIEQWVGFSSVELDLNLRGWALLRLGYFDNHDELVSYFIHVLDFALQGSHTMKIVYLCLPSSDSRTLFVGLNFLF